MPWGVIILALASLSALICVGYLIAARITRAAENIADDLTDWSSDVRLAEVLGGGGAKPEYQAGGVPSRAGHLRESHTNEAIARSHKGGL